MPIEKDRPHIRPDGRGTPREMAIGLNYALQRITSLDPVDARLDGLDSAVLELQTHMALVDTALADISTALATVNVALTTVSTALAAHQTELDNHNATLTAHETELGSHNTALVNHETRISDLEAYNVAHP